MIAPDLVGTVPQWLTGGGVFALVGLWWKRDVALRKISSSEAGDLRDHYAGELAAVRKERLQDREEFLKLEKHLRTIIEESDRRHSECESARQVMRREMGAMQDEIAGLKRQVPKASADQLLILEGRPSEVAPHSTAAARRIKDRGE